VPARGKFITFEGLDGTGKSTQVEKLARSLRAHGHSVAITREPGGTSTGEKVRELLLHSATAGLSPFTEMALMFASRAQHIHEVILPALAVSRIRRKLIKAEAVNSVPSRYFSSTNFSAGICNPT